MYRAQTCPCCGSSEFTPTPALISSFVAAYVLDSKPRISSLLECSQCSFRFFSERFDSNEIKRLYAGYRGDKYFAVRHAHEFWYSKKINDGIGNNPREIEVRKTGAFHFIQERTNLAQIQSVLDFGGDRGQFIPEELGQERTVFEISGLKPVPGVDLISNPEKLREKTYDVVMLCHVLEHCSEPASVLADIKRLAKPEGSYFFIELPLERYNLKLLPSQGVWQSLYRRFLGFMTSTPALLKMVDFYSTVFRIKFNTVPPLGFIKLHEHINFFNEASLRALLERCGFSVVGSFARETNPIYGSALRCLAYATDKQGDTKESA